MISESRNLRGKKGYSALLLSPIYPERGDKKYEQGEFEYFCRKERQIRKILTWWTKAN